MMTVTQCRASGNTRLSLVNTLNTRFSLVNQERSPPGHSARPAVRQESHGGVQEDPQLSGRQVSVGTTSKTLIIIRPLK